MGSVLSKVARVSSVTVSCIGIFLKSDEGSAGSNEVEADLDGTGDETIFEQAVANESSSVNIDLEDDSKSVATENTFNYVPFQTVDIDLERQLFIDKQDTESISTESSAPPMYQPLPSGRVVKRNDDAASMISSSLITRTTQQDAGESEISLEDGVNELFIACQSGEAGLVKLILDRGGIDVNMFPSGDGVTRKRRQGELESDYTPLLIACFNGHAQVVKQLVALPDIVVNKCNKYDQTPLFIASSYGHAHVVLHLLAHPEIDVNKPNKYDETPLQAASRWGHAQVVKHLLAHPEIDVNKPDKYGLTPLAIATRNGQTEIVEIISNHLKPKEDSDNQSSSN